MFTREFVLYNFVKSYFHKLVADIPDKMLADQPMPGVNHAAWIIGHLCIANDYIAKILRNDGLCSPEYSELFGPGSKVLADRDAYPKKADLVSMFDLTHQRATVVVEQSSDEQFSTPQISVFYKDELPLIGDLVAHLMTTHAASHLGQLSTWRRMKGLPSVLGL